MDIRQLRRFVTVAEARSFNKAAELLCVSQPSLTRSIQLLEQSLDATLFDRGPRGIFLTAAGETLMPHAKAILNARERAMASLNTLKGQQGEILAIGTEPSFAVTRLPDAVTQMTQANPRLQIKVTEGAMPAMLGLLREGKVDIAFGARAPYIDQTDLIFEPLAEDGAAIVARAQHPLARAAPSCADLAAARWIVSEDPMIAEGWSQMFTRWKTPTPRVAIHASSTAFIRRCLLQSDVLSVCDLTMCAEEIANGSLVTIRPDADPYHRPSGLFRRAGGTLNRTATAFVGIVRRACAAEAGAWPAVTAPAEPWPAQAAGPR